jgi:hypothetical protein
MASRCLTADGPGGEFEATVLRMGRSDVRVQVGAHHAIEREAPRAVHLLVGMPANERMDWLVEKATELGVASIQPLVAERSVLKLKGERADKKRAHWQAAWPWPPASSAGATACPWCMRHWGCTSGLPLHKRKARAWCCHCSPAPNPCRKPPLATTPSRCCPAPKAA